MPPSVYRSTGYDPARRAGPDVQRPADEDFWGRLRWSIATRGAALLEERYLHNVSRWHRLTEDTLDAVRARLTPRAQLIVWPDLSADVGAVLGERHPLFTAVLPDGDGVLRARWRTEPTPSDRDWAFLKTLHHGQLCTGTVTEIAGFGVTFVDIGGFTAMINASELSWRRFDHPSDVVTVGQEISAQVLDIDMMRERVSLSLKALQADPMAQLAQQVGTVVTGTVTKLVPFGVFVRIEDREDGFEGLVRTTELCAEPAARPEDAVQVGDPLVVRILSVDPARRRIALSRLRVPAPGEG